MSIAEMIEVLCKKHNLSDAVARDIVTLTKHCYVQGSNDAHKAMQASNGYKVKDLTPKNNPYK